MNLIEKLKHARRVSVPLVAIATADQAATIKLIVDAINGGPAVEWDVLWGTTPANIEGKKVAQLTGTGDDEGTIGNPAALLGKAIEFPENTLVFLHNADQFIKPEDTPGTLQGVANLRDEFKQDGRMLILLSPGRMVLPDALRGHVEVMDDPLPDADLLRQIVVDQDQAATNGKPERTLMDEPTIDKAVEAVKGLNAFAAEQAVAMALRSTGIDLDHLWATKKGSIGQITGLSVDDGRETFDDVGGLEQIKLLGRRVFGGSKPPVVVLRMEEIGKVMGGAKTDTSGTSQDALQTLLNCMEDNAWTGVIAYGPAGTGKSFFSKVLAKTFGALSLTFDLNAMKGSLVGQSERQVRSAMNAIKAIGGQRVFLVATSNEMETLPPELRRRFKLGCWYFDMPDEDERRSVWAINRKRFGIPEIDDEPEDKDYSAANIRDCCEVASMMGCSLEDAAVFILPAGVAGKEQIDKSRSNADGKYLSASHPGVYRQPESISKGRSVRV